MISICIWVGRRVDTSCPNIHVDTRTLSRWHDRKCHILLAWPGSKLRNTFLIWVFGQGSKPRSSLTAYQNSSCHSRKPWSEVPRQFPSTDFFFHRSELRFQCTWSLRVLADYLGRDPNEDPRPFQRSRTATHITGIYRFQSKPSLKHWHATCLY